LAVVGMGALIKMQTIELPPEKEDGEVEVGGPSIGMAACGFATSCEKLRSRKRHFSV
ncbi:MAG: hypothetical protein HQ567_29465, partial [Candidatus Nealsonbacteria bacterium]|nr:hypothetical protein [Candidatus Nealsonbacteria bacterium]